MKKRFLCLTLALIMIFSLLPMSAFASNKVVMTAQQFVSYLQYVIDRGDSKYGSGDVYSIGKYDGTYIYFDCWGLGESIICTNGKIVYNRDSSKNPWNLWDTSCGCGSYSGDWLENQCQLSSNFSNMVPGEWLFKENSQGSCYHVGYYIGNGKVIESTSDGSYKTQISSIDSNGRSGLSGRGSSWKWTYHGKVPWISYGSTPTPTDDSLSISGYNYPTSINQGNTFSIYGTVTSGSSNITSLTVGVYNSSGTMKTGKTVNPGSRSYSIANVDAYILFDSLSAGTYYYRITATNSSGTKQLLNKQFTVAAVHTHSYSSSWTYDATNHWHVCSCGATSGTAAHTYGSWATTKAATCTATGTKTRTCTVCGYKQTSTIPKASHEYVEGVCKYCNGNQMELEDDWWEIDSTGTLTITGKGVMPNMDYFTQPWESYLESINAIVISDGVTTIGDKAFSSCNNVQSVTISDSVTSIGEDAFASCHSLESITIPAGVTKIGMDAFGSCWGLENIYVADNNTAYSSFNGALLNKNQTVLIKYPEDRSGGYAIPDGVTSIEDRAFCDAEHLTSLVLPSSIRNIGYAAFAGCYRIKNVYYSGDENEWNAIIVEDVNEYLLDADIHFLCDIGVQPFGDDLFWSIDNKGTLEILGTGYMPYEEYGFPWDDFKGAIKSVVIHEGVKNIRSEAFENCSNLSSVEIPYSVTQIGESAFQGCSSLKVITIPGNVEVIQDYTFNGCNSLVSANIPDSVTNIGTYAFCDCSSLVSVSIPDNVTVIWDRAFYGCRSLANVNIPDGITEINPGTFYGCSSLANVSIPDSVTGIDMYAFDGCSSLESINIPDGVTYIGAAAFNNCSSLTSIVMPDSVTMIGGSGRPNVRPGAPGKTFYGCSSLKSIRLSKNLTTMGSWEFAYCDSLTSVDIPYGVTEIGAYAFYECSNLASVSIPGSVTAIRESAFRYCSSLASADILDGVTEIGPFAFGYCSSLESVSIPDSVTSIATYAFCDCSSLVSVSIPDSVTNIGDYAFESSGLKSINIPKNVESIGKFAFRGCDNLTEITVSDKSNTYSSVDGVLFNKDKTELVAYPKGKSDSAYVIPDGVTSIDTYAFYNCSGLTSVIIPDGVTSIGYGAFCGNSSLASVSIPDSVTSIDTYAFYNCSGLTSVIIPDGVTSVGYAVFYGCSSLVSASIPDSVTNIGDYAFNRSGLKSINIPKNVESIGKFAFYGCDNLTEITVSENSNTYSSMEGVLFNKDKTELVAYPKGKSDSAYVIPDGVTSIGYGSFDGCTGLVSISIPVSVTSIADYAFANCSNLTDVYYTCDNGSSEQWDSISIGANNAPLLNATLHFHKHTYQDVVTAPTCTEQGYTTYTCDCGDSYVDNYVEALGHEYENGTCIRCGAIDPNYKPIETACMISVSSERAKAGDEVTVSVSLENNPGIMAMALGIDYDDTKMQLLGIEDGVLTDWAYSGTAVWIGAEDSTENGEIIKLRFKVLEGVEDGDVAVSIVCSDGDISNYDEESITPELISGKVTVYSVDPGDMNGDGTINAIDLVRLKKYIAGADVVLVASGDVTGDGKVNAMDLVRLQKYLSGADVVLC